MNTVTSTVNNKRTAPPDTQRRVRLRQLPPPSRKRSLGQMYAVDIAMRVTPTPADQIAVTTKHIARKK